MHFLQLLASYLVCCWCLAPTSSSAATDVQKVMKEMRTKSNDSQRSLALVAASLGRNLFDFPQNVSEDCVRTAKVAMDLLRKPSTYMRTYVVWSDAINAPLSDGQPPNNVSANAIELICENVVQAFKSPRNAANFPNLEQLKRAVQLPKPTKSYFAEIRADSSIPQMINYSLAEFDVPEIVEYFLTTKLSTFLDYKVGDDLSDSVVTSKAILLLAEQETFKLTIDSVYQAVLDQYIREIASQNIDFHVKFEAIVNNESFLKRVDENFRRNSVLKGEYEKIRRQVIDEECEKKKLNHKVASICLKNN